mmetsp:Transcript_8387/g.10359  ORF Transcript_8387/g.10359 Transcript_8387/m.10359 type:complete len:87 (-) Transcript_8387:43-303(-)
MMTKISESKVTKAIRLRTGKTTRNWHMAMENDSHVSKKAGERGKQALAGTNNAQDTSVQRANQKLGEIQVNSEKPGPDPKLKNMVQ